MRVNRSLLIAAVVLLCAAAAFSQSGKPLSTMNVVQMVKGGFDESHHGCSHRRGETSFDTSVQALMALKAAGVSRKKLFRHVGCHEEKSGSSQNQPAPLPQWRPRRRPIPDSRKTWAFTTKLKGLTRGGVRRSRELEVRRRGKSMLTGGSRRTCERYSTGRRASCNWERQSSFDQIARRALPRPEYMRSSWTKRGPARIPRVTGGVYHSSGGAQRMRSSLTFRRSRRNLQDRADGIEEG